MSATRKVNLPSYGGNIFVEVPLFIKFSEVVINAHGSNANTSAYIIKAAEESTGFEIDVCVSICREGLLPEATIYPVWSAALLIYTTDLPGLSQGALVGAIMKYIFDGQRK
jgi:hypothetical protein